MVVRWHYKRLEMDLSASEYTLTQLGYESWELVAIHPMPYNNYRVHFFLKRMEYVE